MLWWIAQNFAVTLALAALVWFACRFLSIGPVGRHALWLVVLVKMLTPPLVAWPWAVGEPAWTTASVPQANPADAPVVVKVATDLPGDASDDPANDAPLNPPIVIILPAEATSPDQALLPVAMTPAPALPAVGILAPATSAPVADAEPAAGWLLGSLAAICTAGSLVFFGIEFFRARRMVRLVRQSRPADESLVRCVEQLSRRLSIRPIRVVQVAELASPAVWCIGRPVLLWPAQMSANISQESVRGLILHELAHVRRRDHWVGWIELLAGGLWWWNPLYWYVRHQVRENAELACDGWVVDAMPGGRRAYAEGLLSVCEFISRRSAPMPAVGVNTGGRRFLERRLAMIMKERVGLRLPRLGLVTIALLAMTALPAWSYRPVETPTPENTAEGESPRKTLRERTSIVRTGDVLHSYGSTYIGGLELTSREHSLRQELISTLQQLKAQAVAAGRQQEATAIDARIVSLQAEDGVNLTSYRGRSGQMVRIPVVGNINGWVWGGADGIYTDDSDLGTAAVHAGQIKPGERTTIQVEILAGRESYQGCEKNGVTSSSYGAWQGSYRIIPPVRVAVTRTLPAAATSAGWSTGFIPAGDPLAGARGQADKGKLVLVLIEVIGATTGSVWGDGVYTDDSSVAAAAVHAGLVKTGQRATVVVQVIPGRESYVGSVRNGVTSGSYGAWGGSFQLLGTVETRTSIRDAGASLPGVDVLGFSGDVRNEATLRVTPATGTGGLLHLEGSSSTATLTGPKTTGRVVDLVATLAEPRKDPGNLSAFRGGKSDSMVFEVTGAIAGTIWGDGVYTDDSWLATVAVHSGLLDVGETGQVKVTLKPGRDEYAGSTRNGITSNTYGPWQGSYCVERVEKSIVKPAPR